MDILAVLSKQKNSTFALCIGHLPFNHNAQATDLKLFQLFAFSNSSTTFAFYILHFAFCLAFTQSNVHAKIATLYPLPFTLYPLPFTLYPLPFIL